MFKCFLYGYLQTPARGTLLDLLPVWKIDGLVGLAACWVYAQPEGGQVARAVNYIPDLARPKTSRGRGQGVASHHAVDATLRGPVCSCERSKEAPLV